MCTYAGRVSAVTLVAIDSLTDNLAINISVLIVLVVNWSIWCIWCILSAIGANVALAYIFVCSLAGALTTV